MSIAVIRALRVCIILLGLGALIGQAVYVPVAAWQSADAYPELAGLAVPYTIAAIVVLACVQAAVVAVWVLLSLVQDRRIFDPAALRWVDVIIVAAAVATAVTVATLTHLISWVGVGGPPALLLQAASLVGGVSFVLLMVVMRALLRSATVLSSEMAAVV
ncbi:DUF2975 domain-containing protein [Paenibacillus sp. TRM 82003]|uniref:DUF2975 domain-containing protein n=1 Tax=Kineococcus sp. TRM81007 TaxID=2925831 RepID=UPI001F585458|nr:DUF2975 domain-containing protein [Kineococcus sp. TRM81007]MCI2237782.1 DUF2975 domain-containing protein [Kineococcus sp. TRM81007]MCI3921801.1 DUF2975 domain-containing protein [Paenibacillus sp. TRM 82003]